MKAQQLQSLKVEGKTRLARSFDDAGDVSRELFRHNNLDIDEDILFWLERQTSEIERLTREVEHLQPAPKSTMGKMVAVGRALGNSR